MSDQRTFSQRMGVLPASDKPLARELISADLRVALWNFMGPLVEEARHYYGSYIVNKNISLWTDLMKNDVDLFSGTYFKSRFKDYFFNANWNTVYDTLEYFVIVYRRSADLNRINSILARERSFYRFVDGILLPAFSSEEIAEIECISGISSRFQSAKEHFGRAIGGFNERINPDYKAVVREAILAAESASKVCAARFEQGVKGGTIANAIKVLKNKTDLHQTFFDGIEKLYGWTNAEGGVRHGSVEINYNVTEAEARFMIVVSASYLNYISTKFLE